MPVATIDGIPTWYEVSGDGPPLLMFSPGGFDSTLENWTRPGLYPRIELMARLRERGYRVGFQGVAMHRPNDPGYSRPAIFAIDDWR